MRTSIILFPTHRKAVQLSIVAHPQRTWMQLPQAYRAAVLFLTAGTCAVRKLLRAIQNVLKQQEVAQSVREPHQPADAVRHARYHEPHAQNRDEQAGHQ